MTSPLAPLGEVRARGWKILEELVRGKDAAQNIAALKLWKRDLVAAVKPISEVRAIKLGTLGPIEPASKKSVDTEDSFARRYVGRATSKDRRHLGSIYYHAVRLHRLDKLLDEIKGMVAAKPKARSGRKKIDDSAIVAVAESIMATQERENKTAAVEQALGEFGLSAEEAERARARILRRKI